MRFDSGEKIYIRLINTKMILGILWKICCCCWTCKTKKELVYFLKYTSLYSKIDMYFLPNAKTITWRYEKHPKVQLTAEIIFQDYKGMQKLSISV